MGDERPYDSLNALDEKQLERFRSMWRSGLQLAPAAALHYCQTHSLQVPPWLVAATNDLLCDLLKREISKKRGRSTGIVARHRQDMVDFDRWEEVKNVRAKQKEFKENVKHLRSLGNVPRHILDEQEKMREALGSTLDRAFACAALMLQGTDSFGGAEAIKRSYFKIERDNKSRSRNGRYHALEPRFLKKIGIEHSVGGSRRSSKIMPLFG